MLSGGNVTQWTCPQCGYTEPSNTQVLSEAFFRPWHVRGKGAVKAYVETLGQEAREWLLALYVDSHLQLLAVEAVARGDIGSCPIPLNRILVRAFQLKAAAYILVHNHPSGDPCPSETDLRATVWVARLSADLEVPLLDHLIIAGDDMYSCGYF